MSIKIKLKEPTPQEPIKIKITQQTGGGVSKQYVDSQDLTVLGSSIDYTDDSVAKKQDILTAGANITIENNIIDVPVATISSSGAISAVDKERLDLLSQPTYVKWSNDGYFVFVSVPQGFTINNYPTVQVGFVDGNPIDEPFIKIDDKDYPLYVANQRPKAGEITQFDICFISFSTNRADTFALDSHKAYEIRNTLEASNSDLPTEKAVALELEKYATNTDLQETSQVVSENTYNASVAYVDSLVKEYETVSLYITPTGLSTNKPTGTGSIIEKVLNTTEQLIWEGSYIVPNDGVVLKDNLYIENMFFNSISTSRVTYLRSIYTVNDVVVFNILSAMNNTVGSYEVYRQILNQLNQDLNYSSGAVAKLRLSGYVSSGSDRIEFLINDINTPSGLYRNAPISTLSANKIKTFARGFEETQEEFNAYILGLLS